MSACSLHDYAAGLRNTLNPRLCYCLKLCVTEQPSDPIDFLETHLRHLSLDFSEAKKVLFYKFLNNRFYQFQYYLIFL